MKFVSFLFTNRSLFFKLCVAALLPLGLVTVCILFLTLGLLENSLVTRALSKDMRLASMAALALATPQAVYNKNLLDTIVDSLHRQEDVLKVVIVDSADQRILSQSGHRGEGQPAESFPDIELHLEERVANLLAARNFHQTLFVQEPVVISGQEYARVTIGFSMEQVGRDLRLLRRNLLAIILGATLLGLALAILLANALNRPIQLLAQQARAIGRGLLDQDIVYCSKDAVGDLARALNTMAGSLKSSIGQLEKNEQRYRSVFESSNDGILIIDQDGAMDYNARAAKMFRSNEEPLTGLGLANLSPQKQPDGKESAGKAAAILDSAFAGRKQRFYWQGQRLDGSIFDAEISLLPLHISELSLLLMVVRDITGQRRADLKLAKYHENLEKLVDQRTADLEEKNKELEKSKQALTFLLEDVNEIRQDLEVANSELAKLDRLKSMFIASMSHELRTPLNSIIGFTGIILQGLAGEINEEQKDQLTRVYSSAKHLLLLITDVIDISKIEAGKIEPYFETFELAEVVREALDNLGTQAADKGIELRYEVDDGVELVSDRRRLYQCLLNYLSNGIKYSEHGSVILKASALEQEIEISVTDTGIGIPPEDMAKLFGSFVRLDSHLKINTPGTGLGLYLTKKLATDVLGGRVGSSSRVGEGSTFTLTVPLAPPPGSSVDEKPWL